MSTNYVVFRFVDGIQGGSHGAFATLWDAYLRALKLQQDDTRDNSDYRIRGPVPEPVIYARLVRTNAPVPTTTIWYVLDSSNARPPVLRASVVLRMIGQPMSGLSAGTRAAKVDSRHASPEPGTSRRTDAVSRAVHSAATSEPSPSIRYTVVRVENEHRYGVKGGFRSLDEACNYALALQRGCFEPNVTFEVEYRPSTRPQVKERRVQSAGERRPRRRAAPSIFSKADSSTRIRRHDWEIEDRPGDMPVFPANDDELLGLGTPAQWGKGRRSRKGWYIP